MTATTSKIPPEQNRLNIGLRVWMWGTLIQLAAAAIFTLVHVCFLLAYNSNLLSQESGPAFVKVIAFAGLIYNIGLIGAWGCKTYGAARIIRTIGDPVFNISTLVARLLMVLGSTVVFYCVLARFAQVIFADPGKPPAVSLLWTLPVPFAALFLIGAASLAILIAKRAGTIKLGLGLATLLMIGVVPDLISLMTLRAQTQLADGESLNKILQVAAAFSTVLLTAAIVCELIAVRKLRQLVAS